ncbi:ubiquitin carboxyl-terminal hydrolase 12-like [Hordeum vulgare]|nr:ubiquitin carboxyl-terminal hydrolase 12-like [Hordeum vulgare]
MPGLAAAEQDAVSLVRRVARALKRRISYLVALLFCHKVSDPAPARAGRRGICRPHLRGGHHVSPPPYPPLVIVNQVDLSHPDAELRLLEVFYHKIYKIFAPTEKIENINDQYWTLRAEEASMARVAYCTVEEDEKKLVLLVQTFSISLYV